MPVSNANLSDDQRRFEGEYALFISCPWRIDDDAATLCSWSDDDDRVDTILGRLIGETIISASPTTAALDLGIRLENGLTMRAFCDRGAADDIPNYSLFTPSSILSVLSLSRVREETR